MNGREVCFRTDDGLRLVATAWGDPDAPAVLFQHGGGQTRHSWKGSAEALANQGWYALSLDLRGHGDSDWDPATDYTLTRYGQDSVCVARALGRPPVVVGASLGGISALLGAHGAESAPFSALVLVDVTPRMDLNGAAKIMGFMSERVLEGFANLEEAADAIATYLPHRPRPKNTDGLAKNLRQRENGRWFWHWDPAFMTGRSRPGLALRQEDLLDAARALSIPAMLIRGRMSELVGEEHAREFLELVPHARFEDVSGAGHMVAGDENDAFTEAVARFLGDLDRP
ncbi:MAG: alpha/beta hydrolase [Deltaproteobacteria bacterium]|nr:alpha/beta hydrolase [Deltaproteobacteria bacterium]MBW2393523.1 alpha/beta hydrolase [Deltaproteobacteria bacterium]